MTARSAFDRLGTAAKLLLVLSLIMLPIGGLLVWSALRNLDSAGQSIAAAAQQRARLSARNIEGLVTRNALALRVAASGALRTPGPGACAEAARTLALAPGIARQFQIEDAAGTPLCAVGNFADIVNPPRTAVGEMRAWIAEDGGSLLLRTAVPGGSATTRLARPELARTLHNDDGGFASAVLTDGRRRIDLVPARAAAGGVEGEMLAHPIVRGGGPLDLRITSAARTISFAAQLMILLPALMWALASFVTWWLVNRLLVRPLRKLQRSVTAYQPGDDPAMLWNEELGPAVEIHDLREAFVRAVARIEETEHGMAEALEGQRKLVREVHHRVKNNLQVVASLLSIHGRSASSREGKAAFSAIGRRVDALSVVHRNHYAELEDNQGIALGALLSELGQGLRASGGETESNVAIEIEAERVSTTQDVAVAIAFLITEIVEYAMLQGSNRPVEISLRRASPLTGKLSIGSTVLLDPDEGDGAEPAPERKQFERIIEGLARQLRSPLDRKLGRYSVDLPIFPER